MAPVLKGATLMAKQALNGITVLDLTQYIAGPYCTKLLADYGAEVIKVENPGAGDVSRKVGPFSRDRVDPEKSGLFWHLNGNKLGTTLNLKDLVGRRIFLELMKTADVVVENYCPRVMPSLGLDYETILKINPNIIMVSISNFGQKGPYRDLKMSEIMIYAMGGPMHATGLPEREPIKLGGNALQYHGGAVAAAATSIALWDKEVSGLGDHLDVSLYRAQAANQDRRTTMLIGYQYTGEVLQRKPAGGSTAVGVRPCADGYVNVMGSTERFSKLVRLMDQTELLVDERFDTPMARAQPTSSEEFDLYYVPWLLQYTKQELFQMTQEARIPSGPLYDEADLQRDSHFHGRGAWEQVAHQESGTVLQTGRPFIMNETPWLLRRAAPSLGEHNREVLCGRLGYSYQDLGRLKSLGAI